MKKNFALYAVIWAVLFAVYNIVVFFAEPLIPGYEFHYDARFWVSWGFIIATFCGNLICSFIVFKEDNRKKLFYNIPVVRISWSALIMLTVAGCALMLIPDVPSWIAVVACVFILAFYITAAVKALWAAEEISTIDKKIETKTSFIKEMIIESESILACARNDEIKAECKKVYEALKYSDPVSDERLSAVEKNIADYLKTMREAVISEKADDVKKVTEEIITLVGERNRKCKSGK